MNVEDLLAVLSRWIHVGAAIALVGGTVFQRFVLAPSLAAIPETDRGPLREAVLARWRIFVHSGVALLLLSGVYNAMKGFVSHKGQGLYHGLLGTKIFVALAIFGVAVVLTGKSERAKTMRGRSGFWLSVLVVLATAVVCLSGVLRNLPAT